MVVDDRAPDLHHRRNKFLVCANAASVEPDGRAKELWICIVTYTASVSEDLRLVLGRGAIRPESGY